MRSALLIALALPAVAFATPMQLTHQGRLLDSSGAPQNGTLPLTIGLHATPTGEDSLWSESFPSTPIAQGYYSVVLGADDTALPSQIFQTGAPIWVSTTVDGVELFPRTTLTNVPYAIIAEGVATPVLPTIADTMVSVGEPATSGSITASGFSGTRLAQVVGDAGARMSVNGQAPVAAASIVAGDAIVLTTDAVSYGTHSVQLVVGDTVANWTVEGTADNATCRTLLDSGAVTADGTQTIDPDGAGGAAPFTVWCDMANGGWTYAAQNTPFELGYVGAPQAITTPVVPTVYEWTVYGAAGGGKGHPAQNAVQHGAAGGMAKGRKLFEPSTPLYVYVGGEGTPSDVVDDHGCQNLVGGYNGGGRASRGGASGGGATDVRLRLGDLHSRILVGGGGGGCAYGGIGCETAGGVGGGLTGGDAANPPGRTGGRGGTQTAGGVTAYNSYSNGRFGQGGDAFQCNDEAGGGGGWYGGSGGGLDNNTGGGGSSYYGGMDSDFATAAGVQQRNGRATYIFR